MKEKDFLGTDFLRHVSIVPSTASTEYLKGFSLGFFFFNQAEQPPQGMELQEKAEEKYKK